MRLRVPIAAGAGALLVAAGGLFASVQAHGSSVHGPSAQEIHRAAELRASQVGIHKIKHVVVIMQENRSFDDYFGTYPGADGIPPGVCVPDPLHGGCQKPFVDHDNFTQGGVHNNPAFMTDVDGGKMDGFLAEAESGCAAGQPCNPVVMSHHVKSDIPNYWAYAQNYVLNDRMFESDHSWSLPAHLYEVSAWSADCKNVQDPMSCKGATMPVLISSSDPTPFGWTDLTWLLNKFGVSWGYYLDHGARSSTDPQGVPPIWNVLPGFTDLQQPPGSGVQPLSNFTSQAAAGALPAVSWIIPDPTDSEHPPSLVSTGQAYVTNIINTVMRSSDWNSTAIFLAWDDWGGFYDNVNPLRYAPDSLGYGIRVPGLVISPYAKKGFIDPQTLSFDAYLKFIEEDFLGGQALDPASDGRPDPRPDVREQSPILGDLSLDFNFTQLPRPPMFLTPCPLTTLVNPAPNPTCTNSVALNVKSWGDS